MITTLFPVTVLVVVLSVILEVFLNALPIWQFEKCLYVMVRRLPSRFIGECSGYFRCLSVVYWFVNTLNVKDFIHKKILKCALTYLCGNHFNHHIQLWQVGNLANVI